MNSIQEIKATAARLNRNADFPARTWNEVKGRNIGWSNKKNNVSRSVQWSATKQARKLITAAGEKVRRGYLIINGEVWLVRSNPYIAWIENAQTHQQIILVEGDKIMASPMQK